MKTLIASVVTVVVALVGCSSADQAGSPAPCAGTATSDAPSSSSPAQQGMGTEGTAGAGADASASVQKTTELTLVERCKDDLTCTIGGGSGPIEDGTARLRSVAGECFFTLHWGSDTFTHKLEKDGVTDGGKWTSDTQHLVVTYGGGVVVEDCSLP